MNRFHILTLFPDMVRDGLNTSIIGRAIEAGHLEINAVNIRDYSTNKHLKVDDYPYGGGAGLVMQPEPIYRAYQDRRKNMKKAPRVIYLTPQGQVYRRLCTDRRGTACHGYDRCYFQAGSGGFE